MVTQEETCREKLNLGQQQRERSNYVKSESENIKRDEENNNNNNNNNNNK